MRILPQKFFAQQEKNQSFNVRNLTQDITLQVMIEAVFGIYEGERALKLKYLLCEVLEQASSPLRVSFLYFPKLKEMFGVSEIWKRYVQKKEQADQLIYQEIKERREKF